MSPGATSTATGWFSKEGSGAPERWGWKAAMNAFAVAFPDRVPI